MSPRHGAFVRSPDDESALQGTFFPFRKKLLETCALSCARQNRRGLKTSVAGTVTVPLVAPKAMRATTLQSVMRRTRLQPLPPPLCRLSQHPLRRLNQHWLSRHEFPACA